MSSVIEILEKLSRKYIVQIYCSPDGYSFEAWYDKIPSYYNDCVGESDSKTFEEGIVALNENIKTNLTKLLEIE